MRAFTAGIKRIKSKIKGTVRMKFHILTLFPEMIMQGLSESIIGRASEKGLLSIEAVNIRDYTLDKHKKVDDYPYGGGAGMLMQAQPVYDAWQSVSHGKRVRTVYLTPQGQTFTQPLAKELAQEEELILLCGHYEGIDERVLEEIVTDYVSIGDYVLTGGELPAMVMVDAIARMVPGVLNNDISGITESFEGNLLEYPQYSRPEIWNGKRVPEVLLSGNPKKIHAWRVNEAEKRTKARRPDLYQRYEELQNCLEILKQQKLLHMDMIELIVRGQARLVFAEGENICLQDQVSRYYFHTASDRDMGIKLLKHIECDSKTQQNTAKLMLVLHQEEMVKPAQSLFGFCRLMECYQSVYTKKEKLPITGLYRLDGRNESGREETDMLPDIRQLELKHMPIVQEHYHLISDPAYIRDRIEKGWMYGAFFGEELLGFAGMHAEGSIGMLEVFPQYRCRKIGKALVTYLINLSLEHGFTPYGQAKKENEASLRLQESLGLCFAKKKVYWLE